MKVKLLKKMVGMNTFHPAGSVVDLPDVTAMKMLANRIAQMVGPDGKPIPFPPSPGVVK